MNKHNDSTIVTKDSWADLKKFTSARIALGRSGGSTPTSECLDFRLCHARAKDAVNIEFDIGKTIREVESLDLPYLQVATRIHDRASYLRRPDLGRKLDPTSIPTLQNRAANYDLAIIVTDGLSALAVHSHVHSTLDRLLAKLRDDHWHIAPIVVCRFGRVALQDEIGSLLGARIALILLGERPGLGSPDSLGAYFVYSPRIGNTDAQRNCVSNIRPQGLPPSKAAETLHFLLSQARSRQVSGVRLKDERVQNGSLVNSKPNPLSDESEHCKD